MTNSTCVGRAGVRARRTLLCVSTILAVGVAAPSFAQAVEPAPVRQSIDKNGVDLFQGTFNVDATGISLGQGENGLAYYPVTRGRGWSNNLIASLTLSGTTMKVDLGGKTDSFTGSGSSWTPTEANGSTLTYNSSTRIYTYTQADGTVMHFNKNYGAYASQFGAEGHVTDITKPDGSKLTFNYDSLTFCTASKEGTRPICTARTTVWHITSVVSNSNYQITFGHGPAGAYDPNDASAPPDWAGWQAITSATGSNIATGGATITASFNNGPSTFTVTDPMSRVTSYRMALGGGAAVVAGITRPGGTSEDVTVSYDASNRVSGVTTHAGTTSYTYVDAGDERTTTVTDPLGHATVYKFYIGLQRMKSMTTPAPISKTTSWQYDGNGRVTQITFPEGNYKKYTYDARGNVTEERQVSKTPGTPPDIVTSASFPATCVNAACNKPTWTRNAKLQQTDYTYNATTGEVVTVTAPAPVAGAARPTTVYGYTAVGGVQLVSSISTCRTAATCIGSANEVRTTIGYNSNLLPTTVTKAAGDGSLSATTTIGYDAIGNRTSVDGPLAGTDDTTTYRYDASRVLIGEIGPDPDGAGPRKRRAFRRVYSGLASDPTMTEAIGAVDDLSDAAWNNFSEAYRRWQQFDPEGRVTRHTLWSNGVNYAVGEYLYDAAGRLTCRLDYMDPAQWGAEPNGCAPLQTNGPNGSDRVTQYGYDAADRLTQITRGVGTADAATEVASYTDNGQVASITDGRNNKTTYSYDGFDRLVKTQYPSPTVGSGVSSATDYEQLTLDPNGNVTARRLRDGTSIGYTYDALNRLSHKDLPGSEPDVDYSYDLLGQLTGVSRPGDGVSNSFAYDALGRMTSDSQSFGSLSYQYDLAGNRTRMTWQDGFYVDYDHDVTGNVTKIRENGAVSGVGVLASYTYDDLGRRASVTRGNGTTTSYGYDAVSRLSSLTQAFANPASNLALTFGYNPASQIASRTASNDGYAWNGAVNVNRGYTTNGLNQYSAAGGTAFGYDARGNLTASGSNGYGYSSENLLKTAPGISLYYDPLGRLHEYDTSVSTRMMYDGGMLSAEIANPSGAILRRYVPGPGTDEPIVWYEGAGTADRRWLHTDERGSVVAISNASGTVTNINSYDEYGIPGSGNIGRFGYTGQVWLAELGMYNYKARIYSPSLGRFMQTDPIGYADGLNWYNYVGNDPINATDPTGMLSDIVVCGGGVSIGGLCLSRGAFEQLWDRAKTAQDREIYSRESGGCPEGDTTCEIRVTARKKAKSPQKDKQPAKPSVGQCALRSGLKNGASTAIDIGGVALTVFAPEARLAQLGAAGAGLVAAGATGDLPGLGNGLVGYHFMMADWATLSSTARTVVKVGGALSGATALLSDAYNLYNDYADCRAGK